MNYFTKEWAAKLVAANKDTYQNNYPFPHIIIDNFIKDESVLDSIIEEYGAAGKWINRIHKNSKKRICHQDLLRNSKTKNLLEELNGQIFLKDFLEGLTGIHNIKGDPNYFGGGLHQTSRDGFLNVHVDFNWHEQLQMHRRINVLIYLNKDWKEQYGGDLELWNDKEMILKIAPIFNRCVIFNTSEFSYHGHPHPLKCPRNISRRSIAMYYYTKGLSSASDPHSTIYKKTEK